MSPLPVPPVLAAALADELEARGFISLGTPICEAIIIGMFKRVADAANNRPVTALEAEDISRRSA